MSISKMRTKHQHQQHQQKHQQPPIKRKKIWPKLGIHLNFVRKLSAHIQSPESVIYIYYTI